ncbi:hypothetical protein EIP91_011954 [Steccherinum ochraceum]|uniref:Uncharacterized protein n=1 Tax=Steccherinum ochraceum TaxID=92696 RepID=A0A4R0RVB5_9APHY|nr:hypothetical protein EIP91_011954 [Steccherinum ochraceum]
MRTSFVPLIALMGAIMPGVFALPIYRDRSYHAEQKRSQLGSDIVTREDSSDSSGAVIITNLLNPPPPTNPRMVEARRLTEENGMFERRLSTYSPTSERRDDTSSDSGAMIQQFNPLDPKPAPKLPPTFDIARRELDARFGLPPTTRQPL